MIVIEKIVQKFMSLGESVSYVKVVGTGFPVPILCAGHADKSSLHSRLVLLHSLQTLVYHSV